MKDPVKILNEHQKDMDEIFGKIAKFFSSSKKKDGISYTPWTAKYKLRGGGELKKSYIPSAEQLEKQTQDYQSKIDAYRLTSTDPAGCVNSDGKKPKETRKVEGNSKIGIKIDNDKFIMDFSELYIEKTVRGQGSGVFRNITVRDFVCYDIEEDLYGISWLMSEGALYYADKVSGKLYANKFNQPVVFEGKWIRGKFYGTGPKILSPSASAKGRSIDKEFNNIKNLIISVKDNFDSKIDKINLDELKQRINKKVEETKDKELQYEYEDELGMYESEFNKIKKYLTFNIERKKGTGTSSYINSIELKKIKSMIDKKMDQDVIYDEIIELKKYISYADTKFNEFYKSYQNLLAKYPTISKKSVKPTTGTAGGSTTPAKKAKKFNP